MYCVLHIVHTYVDEMCAIHVVVVAGVRLVVKVVVGNQTILHC